MPESSLLPAIARRLRRLIDVPSNWGRELDVSQQRLYNYLHGRAPNADFLRRICELKHVNVNWLLTGEGEPYLRAVEQGASRVAEEPAEYQTEAELSAISFALARNSALRRAVSALLQRGRGGEEAMEALSGMSGEQLVSLGRFLKSVR